MKATKLPAALALLGEILREPAFPEAEFDAMKRRSRAGSEMTRTDPAALATNRLARALSPYPPGDVRYVPTPEESAKRLEALTLADVVALYEKQLGAMSGEVGIVGDFEPDAAVAALRRAIKRRTAVVMMSESTAYDEPRVWWKEWVKRRIVRRCGGFLVGGTDHVAYIKALLGGGEGKPSYERE